jgi:hypothetical protein
MLLAGYIASMILGGALLVSSLVFDHHGGGHEVDHAGQAATGTHGVSFALSLRFWTYLLAFGGATGLLLHSFAHLGEPLAFGLSVLIGAVSGLAAQFVVYKMSSDAGGTVSQRELVFKLGNMLLPAAPGISSRVRVTANNSSIDLIAITDDSSLAARDEVVILEIKDGVARVTKNQPAGEKP